MVPDLHCFDLITFQWCKTDKHSVETIFQSLNFDLSQAGNTWHNPLS